MINGEFRRLLEKAILGDRDALGLIIEVYMPLINKHSNINGSLDEDCRQFIMLRVFLAISKFEI